MTSTAVYLACLVIAGLWTMFSAVAATIAFSVSESYGHRWHRRWGRGCLRLIGVDVTYIGFERLDSLGSVILASNHESMWDIMVLAAMPYDFKWIAKKEISRFPLFGRLFRKMGSFYVSRDRSGADLNIMRAVEDGLKNGKSVVIFPEGTRTRTGELLPFKKGAFRTAQASARPLVPVAITGTYAIAPPGQLPTARGHRVTVRFGDPLTVPPGEELGAAMERYRRALLALLAVDRA